MNEKVNYDDIVKILLGLTNRQIGELFGNISYSDVAKVYQRFAAKLKADKSL